ncbi:MAG: hypothetical protein CMK54_06810 [Proteobacteria bacterium]|nr:hypothetical protein [Pseudomonadota bacterium]
MTIQQKIILVLDTECCDLAGNVYDVGYTIATRKGEILTRKNWLVEEVFTDPDKMMGAFYAKKLFSHYAPMLDAGTIGLAPWSKIVAEMQIDVDAFGVNVLAAYNLGFDRRVMRQTNARFGLGPILPPMEQLDIWQFACETKLSQARYKEIARSLGWVSAAGNIRTGAEYAYRFCSGDHGFIEDHTALSDAVIETKIMADCYACKKSVPYGVINAQPWRIVNEKETKKKAG